MTNSSSASATKSPLPPGVAKTTAPVRSADDASSAASSAVALECHSYMILEELSAMVDDEGSDYDSDTDDESMAAEEDDMDDSGKERKSEEEEKRAVTDAALLHTDIQPNHGPRRLSSSVSSGLDSEVSLDSILEDRAVSTPTAADPFSAASFHSSSMSIDEDVPLVRLRDARVIDREIRLRGGSHSLFRSRSDVAFSARHYPCAGSDFLGRVIRSASGGGRTLRALALRGNERSFDSADGVRGNGLRRNGTHRMGKNASYEDEEEKKGSDVVNKPTTENNNVVVAAMAAVPCPKARAAGRELLANDDSFSTIVRRSSMTGITRRGSADTAGSGAYSRRSSTDHSAPSRRDSLNNGSSSSLVGPDDLNSASFVELLAEKTTTAGPKATTATECDPLPSVVECDKDDSLSRPAIVETAPPSITNEEGSKVPNEKGSLLVAPSLASDLAVKMTMLEAAFEELVGEEDMNNAEEE